MSGVAELKAGPTQEQQQRARMLRERLLIDLQEQVLCCIKVLHLCTYAKHEGHSASVKVK